MKKLLFLFLLPFCLQAQEMDLPLFEDFDHPGTHQTGHANYSDFHFSFVLIQLFTIKGGAMTALPMIINVERGAYSASPVFLTTSLSLL